MTAPFEHILALAVFLFALGLLCSLTRRSLIMILLGVEVMLNACAIVLVAGSLKWRALDGQAFTLFLMALGAAEAAVGLALFVYVRKRAGTLDSARISGMKG